MKIVRKLLTTLNGRVCCLLLICCDFATGAEERVIALASLMTKHGKVAKPIALASAEFVLTYFGLVPHEVETEVVAVAKAATPEEVDAATARLQAAIKSAYAPYLAQAAKTVSAATA